MKLPELKIGELTAKYPIVQGGMGVGISLSSLASAVANEGGVGIISGVQIGFKEPDFEDNPFDANMRALKKEIKKARKLSPDGIIGINLMTAMKHYKEYVLAAVKEGIDIIVSGAGIPKDLPLYVEGTKTKIAPIVSSKKVAFVITKYWDKRYKRIPDMVVVEGPEAGGHLGYNAEQLEMNLKLSDIVKEVIEVLKPFEEKYGRKIPVIAAGGIYTGEDIARYIKLGASGIQMATRFVATHECDADIKFKMEYVNAQKKDISIIHSPVGMLGRAIDNSFIERNKGKRVSIDKCFGCLKTCNPKDTPYCISRALIESALGNTENGVVFVGQNVYRIDKIVKVHELMAELISGAEKALDF